MIVVQVIFSNFASLQGGVNVLDFCQLCSRHCEGGKRFRFLSTLFASLRGASLRATKQSKALLMFLLDCFVIRLLPHSSQ